MRGHRSQDGSLMEDGERRILEENCNKDGKKNPKRDKLRDIINEIYVLMNLVYTWQEMPFNILFSTTK